MRGRGGDVDEGVRSRRGVKGVVDAHLISID